ncbi:MAG: penicillin-binding protein 2 [Gammaproteobacteria bacterium]
MLHSTFKDHIIEARLFTGRAVISTICVLILLLILFLRLADLQLLKHERFTTMSMDNRVRVEPIPPTRGLIYDRNGVLLAQNLPTYSLEITPEKVDDLEQTLSRLGKILPISAADIKRFNSLRKQRRRFDRIPIRVRLSEEEIARFSVNRHRFPGVEIQAKLLRTYPLGEETAHVLGYVGRISEKDLKDLDASNYSGTSHVGKNGVEKFYEEQLHGKVGTRRVEVNALGRVIRVLESEPPTPGANLYLSLDVELQREAIDALGKENGAIVAINPANGSILAMVSNPGFDPNLFVNGISTEDYNALQNSPDKPLFNRALRGRYPPGSTAKPFIGLAGLEFRATTKGKTENCPGYYQLPGLKHKYRDWKKWGHGTVNIEKAIVESCDVYFYDLANKLGIDHIHDFLSRFGFGRSSGIDISGEITGLLPSQEWKRRTRGKSWYTGETLLVGIGQGYFLATPIELASATATLAARGLRSPPRIVEAIQTSENERPMLVRVEHQEQLPVRDISNWNHVINAMTEVIDSPHGTAKGIHTDRYKIAGKTGTAQVFSIKQDETYDEEKIEKRMRDHALFIAFAPTDKPRIAVVVIVENGGHGSSVAAPIARRIMDRYLLGKSQ